MRGTAGILILTGNNTYSGVTTIVTGGTLQIGNGGTTDTLGTGAVVNNAALVFNRSDASTVANVIFGTGAVTQSGTGRLTLTGANSYSGGTVINAGTLSVADDVALGAAAGGLAFGGGTLVTTSSFTTDQAVTLNAAGAPPLVISAPAPGLPGFLAFNLRGPAVALDNANRAGANLNPFFRVYNQPAGSIGRAVNQLSGEVATTTSAMGFASGEQFLATLLDPFGYGRESIMGGRLRAGDGQSAPDARRYAVWGAATGAYNRTTGDAGDGAASRTTRTAGFALGFDHLIGA